MQPISSGADCNDPDPPARYPTFLGEELERFARADKLMAPKVRQAVDLDFVLRDWVNKG
jgi:hypothetical protein